MFSSKRDLLTGFYSLFVAAAAILSYVRYICVRVINYTWKETVIFRINYTCNLDSFSTFSLYIYIYIQSV